MSPKEPFTDVEVWAVFDRAYFAFAGTHFSVTSRPDEGMFYDPRIPKGFLGSAGNVAPDGDSVMGVKPFQLQYPGVDYADISDPIKIWSCSWTTTDFSPRRVDVSLVAPDYFRVFFNFFGDAGPVDYVPEAYGSILVVPAPGAGPAFLLAGTVCIRRRRRLAALAEPEGGTRTRSGQ